MRAFLLTIFMVFASLGLLSQKVYVSLGNGLGVRKLNITNTGCFTDSVVVCPSENYFALALFGNQMFYANNTTVSVGFLRNDTISGCQFFENTPAALSSMTVDNNGIIYGASATALYRLDPNSGLRFELLGAMPYRSAGDMAFFEGELYMAATNGIVKVNITNPGASTLQIPMSSGNVYGLAALSVDCNLNKLYAFETLANNTTNVVELDVPGGRIVGVSCNLPYSVADAASEVEGGAFAGISIKQIKIAPHCDRPGKGMIIVEREPGIAVYTYLLNRTVSNTTGKFEDLDPGTYRIEISTPGGCYLDTSVTVPPFSTVRPVVQEHHLNPDCIAAGKVWFTISPDNGRNKLIYRTDTVSASYQFTGLDEGLHHFSVVDEYFCELGASDIRLAIEGSCDTVYFPSAFTPDNNGRNDYFRGSGNRSVREYELVVYNRWGQVVFHTNTVTTGWNGKRNEIDQPAGLYVWMARYATKAGVRKTAKGTLVLIR